MRGEYQGRPVPNEHGAGSSPHAWGILLAASVSHAGRRFIPTCVGNTLNARFLSNKRSVHPHMRGEYIEDHGGKFDDGGSSPHAWGILSVHAKLEPPPRFIPTCVGNTGDCVPCGRHDPVHPHMRGEYLAAAGGAQTLTGSSPHAWGIRWLPESWGQWIRFIPTCVGNTPTIIICTGYETVHPHMRGEYRLVRIAPIPWPGSSPHAWGILFHKT